MKEHLKMTGLRKASTPFCIEWDANPAAKNFEFVVYNITKGEEIGRINTDTTTLDLSDLKQVPGSYKLTVTASDDKLDGDLVEISFKVEASATDFVDFVAPPPPTPTPANSGAVAPAVNAPPTTGTGTPAPAATGAAPAPTSTAAQAAQDEKEFKDGSTQIWTWLGEAEQAVKSGDAGAATAVNIRTADARQKLEQIKYMRGADARSVASIETEIKRLLSLIATPNATGATASGATAAGTAPAATGTPASAGTGAAPAAPAAGAGTGTATTGTGTPAAGASDVSRSARIKRWARRMWSRTLGMWPLIALVLLITGLVLWKLHKDGKLSELTNYMFSASPTGLVSDRDGLYRTSGMVSMVTNQEPHSASLYNSAQTISITSDVAGNIGDNSIVGNGQVNLVNNTIHHHHYATPPPTQVADEKPAQSKKTRQEIRIPDDLDDSEKGQNEWRWKSPILPGQILTFWNTKHQTHRMRLDQSSHRFDVITEYHIKDQDRWVVVEPGSTNRLKADGVRLSMNINATNSAEASFWIYPKHLSPP